MFNHVQREEVRLQLKVRLNTGHILNHKLHRHKYCKTALNLGRGNPSRSSKAKKILLGRHI